MHLIEHFYRLIAPSNCLGCETEGSLICLWCRESLFPTESSRCYKCNRLTRDGTTCPACRRKTSLKHVFIRTEYTDSAKEIVHKMKFSYSGEAADLIAEELANTIPVLPPEALIVHVPTITSHVRQRGFDHTKRIARQLARRAGRRHLPVLARVDQHRQVGSTRSKRLTQMNNAFFTQETLLVKGAHILLVDDVLTTGATLEAAANELIRAGARSVDAVVFARAK